ncbi:MAG: GGDEF domain-containing protein [Pseudomonadota bacterium]
MTEFNPMMLDRLMPMSLVTDATGNVIHVAPTLAKTRAEGFFEGRSIFDLFQFRRPNAVATVDDLLENADVPMRLAFSSPPQTDLRGTVSEGPGGGVVMNLSFGLSILDAIRTYGLHLTDFAATDPTMEMLYLIEAKSAAMEETHALNRRLQGARIAAEEQAFTDTLTGLKNRRALDHILTRYHATEVEFTLLGIDLDYFKSVNDTFGHAAGDHVLQVVARKLVSATGPDDTVARVGGDELMILLKGKTDTAQAKAFAIGVIKDLEEPIPFEGNTCLISASIGIAATNQFTPWSADCLLATVDSTLYISKNDGRGRATVYEHGMCRKMCSGRKDCVSLNLHKKRSGGRLEARSV